MAYFSRLVVLLLWMCSAFAKALEFQEGPDAGIMLTEYPGHLITDCEIITKRVYIKFDADAILRVHLRQVIKSEGHVDYFNALTMHVKHAEDQIRFTLEQLSKFTMTFDKLSGLTDFKHSKSTDVHNKNEVHKRDKRFLSALILAAATLGTLFNIGYHAITTNELNKHINQIQSDLPKIRTSIANQDRKINVISQTVKDTIIMMNTQTDVLNKTIKKVELLQELFQDTYIIQVAALLLSDYVSEVSSSVESLVRNMIPAYVTPDSKVKEIVSEHIGETISDVQSHLIYSLGHAIPLHVDPANLELVFLLFLPVVKTDNIYRMKKVHNVGFWHNDLKFTVEAPEFVAFHENTPGLLLHPNLDMCTLTRDIHYICKNKPFLRDSNSAICGVNKMYEYSKCAAIANNRSSVTKTTAVPVNDLWLVNTPRAVGILSYNRHNTKTEIHLPNQTFLANIDQDATLTIGELTLYHLDVSFYQSEVAISTFFENHKLFVEPEIEERISMPNTRFEFKALDNVIITAPVSEEYNAIDRSSNNMYDWVILYLLSFLYVLAISFGCIAWKLYKMIVQRGEIVVLNAGAARRHRGDP